MFERGNQSRSQVETLAPTIANADYRFSKVTGEGDFHQMLSKDQEEMYRKLSDENSDLKECLKQL